MKLCLQSTAENMGGTGGLWTVQLGPILDQRHFWDGKEARYEDVRELDLRVALMTYIE